MSRTPRAAAAFAALLGLVLSFLTYGASAPEGAAPGPAPVSGPAPAHGPAPVVLGAAVPGCDPGRAVDEGAANPGVPPRAHGFPELLPALAADRAAPGVRRPDAVGPAAQPGREPPARVPTPVELSVLRV
ncbi:hypothetical protein GCM10010275_06970 [Streptomyces litmocidini]|uniref:hypothetical protein n=1 Tax=Streptomyces litmocidini TaxID=67318 RepID=UPI00167D41A8|nr:hypothetical protein [Streptomyces litmocidini]GGU75322.1 hypothetical protein GCM10010275_06970 [Streptomyces litmocidini]